MAPNTRVTRKWELFAGRNRFYCDGILMSAPHTGVFYLTCFLITGTSALFFAFDCPFLATKITPAIPVIGAILYFFTMSSLLRTTFTDPGVIPRASLDEAAYIEKQIEVPNSLNSPTYRPPPRTKEVLIRGQTVKLKYCFTCKIFRPPRASHCSLCDNCVDRFDHHCPWVGNCVGKRNYRFFYMFLVSLAFLAVFIFACSITHLVLLMKKEQEVFRVIKAAPASVIVTFICFFSIWSVIGLAGFHTYLTTSDQTTNEDLKGSFSSKGGQRAVNPYSRGNICLNCFHILCGPMTPSLIDRRGVVTDEFVLQMQPGLRNQHALNQLTDVTSHPSLVTNQPILGAGDAFISSKQNLYNEPISATGIYRHRSYDNLQNGNSNSLAHLVDNEIPLSTVESPVGNPGENAGITPTSVDDDTMEKITKRSNNLSGSYNNLFRDNLDEYNEQSGDADMKQISDTLRTLDTSAQSAETPEEGTLRRMNKSASECENVYSNIPNTGLSIAANHEGSKTDPNLHVYSNLIEEQDQQNSFRSKPSLESSNIMDTVSKRKSSDKDVENVGSKSTTNMPSTLLCDDLDLDDPVSAFVVNNRKKFDTDNKSKSISTGVKDSSIIVSPISAAPDSKSELIPMHLNAPITITPTATISTSITTSTRESSNNFITPSRLRLLQDTTMIDTALDLDSLDGSSIGNNSQACLKTALV